MVIETSWKTVHNKTKKISGFSLVELVITLLIGSILLAWGVPNYRDFKVRKEVSDNTNELSYYISLARAEAIRYGQRVRFRPNGTDWNNGVRLMLINPGAPNEQLANMVEFDGSLTITQGGGFTGHIIFDSLGGIETGLSTEFRIENPNVSNAYRILQVLPTGSVQVVKP